MARLRLTILMCAWLAVNSLAIQGAELAEEFKSPPDSARPWVYCFWLEGNVTREGITADLEAMQRAGIGGLLFMDGDMGNPAGPHRFMSASWREMFRHMVSEADRLGLEININNDPGWAGSGGPWVKPEQAAQRVVVSESLTEGPVHFDAVLPQPPTAQDFYRDIVVLACPVPAVDKSGSFQRIENFNSTKSFAGVQDFAGCVPWPRSVPMQTQWPVVPPPQCISSAAIQDLTDRTDQQGRLSWDVPAGRWLILRIGHTLAGGITRSSQKEATGLECDKLSKSAVESHFESMVARLLEDIGPLAGKTVVSTHVDSWESGSGNWTSGFRDEFRRRRGYDLLPYLPTLNGLIVDSLEVSERFLWDLRETVSELVLENYVGHMRELADRRGLRLSVEAYDGTCDDLRYAGRADEAMCEFWQRGCYTGLPLCDLVEEMTSAAHVYGQPIVGAEALTSWRGDFLDHPATLKPLSDWAFCAGVNRFCFSEWIMQPWPERVPGVSFLFIGTVFHRAQTWWERSKPWHEYVARCQHMLRQGQYVADICFLTPEGAPHRFVPPIPTSARGMVPDRPPYNFDGCPPELLFKAAIVEDGRLSLPSGMSYRLLVLPSYNADDRPVLHVEGNYVYTDSPLPKVETMTPQLLRRIKELVEAGATVVGTRPLKSPSLVGFPGCDEEVMRLADELWGSGAGRDGRGEHRLGKGRVIWGAAPEQVLQDMNVPADFSCEPAIQGKLRYTHRRTENDLDIYFVANKVDGVVQGVCEFRVAAGQPEIWWPESGRSESMAVYEKAGGVTRVPLRLEPHESVFVVFRPRPEVTHLLLTVTRYGRSIWSPLPADPKITVQKALYGVLGDAARTRDVTARVQAIVDGGETRFAVWRLGEGDEPALQLAKSVSIEYTANGSPRKVTAQEGQTVYLAYAIDATPTARIAQGNDGELVIEAWENGSYEARTAAGRVLRCRVDNLPAETQLDGAWDVSFPTQGVAPETVKFEPLISWSEHTDPHIKYFSGSAVYRKTFHAAPELLSDNRTAYLDFGRVAVIAEARLNGKQLGTLWKTPFRVAANSALRVGENTLELQVTNLWVNRMIGDEQLPEDSVRTPEGLLKSWPLWLLDGQPSPTGRQTFATYRVWKSESPLQESGLLGPVRLYATQRVVAK